jgi:cell division protein ZapA (FtsZ GTPase activity inhibitor)
MDPGGLTPLEVQSLAEFVDEKMREIADQFAIVDTQKIAVLAAINIALDYVQLREQSGKRGLEINPQLEKINQILDLATGEGVNRHGD